MRSGCIEMVVELVEEMAQEEQHLGSQSQHTGESSQDQGTRSDQDDEDGEDAVDGDGTTAMSQAILTEIAAVQWLDRLGLSEHLEDGAEVVVQVRLLGAC